MSNLPFVFFGIYLLFRVGKVKDPQMTLVTASIIFVALGSFCFHATKRFYAELLDELPMVYGICALLVALNQVRGAATNSSFLYIFDKDSVILSRVLFVYCFLFTIVMLMFRGFYVPFLIGFLFMMIATAGFSIYLASLAGDAQARRLLFMMFGLFALGGICWLYEFYHCIDRPMPLHSWWHIFAYSAMLYWGMFTMRLRSLYLRTYVFNFFYCSFILTPTVSLKDTPRRDIML